MKQLYWASVSWLAYGLIAGVFYREFSKANNFYGQTQLSVVHTHALVLGMMMNLLFLIFAITLHIDKHNLFTPFFWVYNIGAIWTVGFLTFHGIYQVLGHSFNNALSGLAGLGHIIITVGFGFFFAILSKQLKKYLKQREQGSTI